MNYFRYDKSVLDFIKGPIAEKVLKMADNCFVRERKDRIKANFRSLVALLQANGYMQLPVPDPLTWGYMKFRY